MDTLKSLLRRVNENLNMLREREAKYGTTQAPIALLNQIKDYQTAIDLIRAASKHEKLSQDDLDTLKNELRPLVIAQNVETIDLDTFKPLEVRAAYEPVVIEVAAGEFSMGCDASETGARDYETPQHTVYLDTFYIAQHPVTNQQYSAFTDATNHTPPSNSSWQGRRVAPGRADFPVVDVTWYDAMAYCQWLSQQTNRAYSLPSEAQWEKAARNGTSVGPFPWGAWAENRCNHGADDIASVFAFDPQTETGLHDLVGNTAEWTTSLWGTSGAIAPDYTYPWDKTKNRDDINASLSIYRIVRGGFYSDSQPNRLSPGGQFHGGAGASTTARCADARHSGQPALLVLGWLIHASGSYHCYLCCY